MYKIRNKKFALLLTIMFVLTIMMPLVTPASAATGAVALQRPDVNDDAVSALGTVVVELPAGALSNGDSVIIDLPKDFEFLQTLAAAPRVPMTALTWAQTEATGTTDYYGRNTIPGVAPGNLCYISVPPTVQGETNALNDGAAGLLTVTYLDDNKIRLDAGAVPVNNRAWFYLHLGAVYVPAGAAEDVKVTFSAPAASGFSQIAGSVVVARVTSGDVTISVVSTDTSNQTFDVTLKLVESLDGALEDRANSLRLRLPDGFVWTGVVDHSRLWGTNMAAAFAAGANVNFAGWTTDEIRLNALAPVGASTTASAFELTLRFDVNDESKIKDGDIKVTVKGNSTIKPSSLTVGTYGDFGVTASAAAATEIFAGLVEQEIADITIKESIAGSLIPGRAVALTLPPQARWQEQFDGVAGSNFTADGVTLNWVRFGGTDDRTAYFTVGGAKASAAKLVLEDVEIVTEPGFTGDIKVTLSGSAGVTGELLVAKVGPAVSVSSDSKPSLVIGRKGQAAGDLIITEKKAEALVNGQNLLLNLADVNWAARPKVEVIEGDIRLGTVTVAGGVATIPIERDSSVASTIKVTGIKYDIDRTIPEGNISVRLRGPAVVAAGLNLVWRDSLNAASAVNAAVGTPAPGDVALNASFVIGAGTYTLNGVEAEMDVVPYVKDGRTYLPVRYVGYALGVAPENILWDGKTATLVKGDKVVQVSIGSKAMIVNGATINLDVAPELKDGRTMLPFRWIAWAFGAAVDWDAETQTVTMKL